MKQILLAEDNINDVELTLSALQECHLANSVEIVRDGAEALDYLYRREHTPTTSGTCPVSCCLTSRCRASMG